MAEKENESPEAIINTYKMMTADCQQIATKISELNLDKDEHRLVVDTLKKLEPERKAFRLVGGVLVQRSVKEVLPEVSQNYDNIIELSKNLESTLKSKDEERKKYKEKHGIMTQEERSNLLKAQASKTN